MGSKHGGQFFFRSPQLPAHPPPGVLRNAPCPNLSVQVPTQTRCAVERRGVVISSSTEKEICVGKINPAVWKGKSRSKQSYEYTLMRLTLVRQEKHFVMLPFLLPHTFRTIIYSHFAHRQHPPLLFTPLPPHSVPRSISHPHYTSPSLLPISYAPFLTDIPWPFSIVPHEPVTRGTKFTLRVNDTFGPFLGLLHAHSPVSSIWHSTYPHR